MAKKKARDEALLNDQEAGDLKNLIMARLRHGKMFWRPLHMRQDLWLSMYLLLDPIQQMKPLGYRRFISNEPRTSVDAAVSILTRNDSFFRIEQNADPLQNPDERRAIGKIERTLDGLIADADELFTMRGQTRFWKQVAQQALLRGWVWTKWHITQAALEYRQSPFLSQVYDSRTVLPHFDMWGLNYVCMETISTLGESAALYPDVFPEYTDPGKFDFNSPAIKVEYWSNNRGGVPGLTGVLACVLPQTSAGMGSAFTQLGAFYDNPLGVEGGQARWIIEPFRHGYTPEQLPVVGVPANSLSVQTKPVTHPLVQQAQERADIYAMQAQAWSGPGTWQADSGRSILSSVEEQVPQYNELVATVLHHFALSAFGTWIFTTPTGEIPEFDPGIEGKIALRPEESVRRAEIQPINADAYRLLALLQDEKQKGVLSNVLQAATGFQGTGVLFQQISNAALNALEPYHDAMELVGMLGGSATLEQMKAASTSLKKFEVVTQTRSKSYFRIEFDPSVDLDSHRKYKPVPVFKPALPDDLAVRINAARLALDPRRPILSLSYVLENILQVDDAQGEIDRMWEDIANGEPVIVLEQIAQALDRMNEPDIAQRIRENEFKAKFIEDLKFRQATGQAIPSLDSGGLNNPSSAGGGQFNAQQDNTGGDLAQQGADILGQMGQKGGV